MKPIISIVMATYCRARIISNAINSILNQTFDNFELIIVDDGSKDGTKEIIEKFALKDDRVRWVRYDKNSGTPAIRYNQGMALAKGVYIAFMFDDDELYPNALETLYDFMQENLECGMVYGQADYVDIRNNSYIGKAFGADWDFSRLVQQGNFLCNLSVLIKKTVINDVGGYDEAPVLKRLCDWDLWVRIGEKYAVKRIAKTVGRVNAFYDDSIGTTIDLNISDIRDHQANKDRPITLKHYWSCKKKIVFITHGHDAVLQRWRIDYLVKSINDLKGRWEAIKIDKFQESYSKLYDADVIVLYRFLVNDSEIEYLKNNKKPLIYDIDDYVFEELGKYNTSYQRRYALHWLKQADIVTVTTPYLANVIEEKEKCTVRKNAVPVKEFKKLDFTKKIKSENLRIGWLGGINRNESNSFILDLLRGVASKRPTTFIYFGKTEEFYQSLKGVDNLSVERKKYVPVEKPQDFYKAILDANLDCIINPLMSDKFFECKSELKYIECGILRIPLITSPRGMFKDIIKHKDNGLLAETVEEFDKAIDFLCDNKNKIVKIKEKAYSEVASFYNIDHERDKYVLLVDSIFKDKNFEGINRNPYKVGINIGKSTSVVGEIFGSKRIVQSFVGEHDNLSRVQILLATYMRKNRGNLEVSLLTDPNDTTTTLRKITLDCSKMNDNDWVDFYFDTVEKSRGVTYYLQIRGLNCTSGSSITAYYNANLSIRGELSINKSKFRGSLCFKVYYLNRD